MNGELLVWLIAFIMALMCYMDEMFRLIFIIDNISVRRMVGFIVTLCIAAIVYLIGSVYTRDVYFYGSATIGLFTIVQEFLQGKLDIKSTHAFIGATITAIFTIGSVLLFL